MDLFRTGSVRFDNLNEGDAPAEKRLLLSLDADDRQAVTARVQVAHDARSERLKDPPYHVDLTTPRARSYYSEQALHAWARMLRTVATGQA